MSSKNVILQNVVNYIEESIRNSTKSNIKYIDLKNQKSRVMTIQNHVIFGRRGAGKSSLLGVLGKDSNNRKGLTIRINIEDFKDIPFPNIIIHILLKMYNSFDFKYTNLGILNFNGRSNRKKLKSKIIAELIKLKLLLSEPEKFELTERKKGTYQESGKTNAKLNAKISEISSELSASQGNEHEISRTYQIDKLLDLRDKISDYKDLINEYSILFHVEYIFLVFDDFYFIPRNIQNKFIDYFHRLTKDTSLYLKVASIRFRSRLYSEESGTYVGTEVNHDIIPIDLDYTLEDFISMSDFMDNILRQINDKFKSEFIEDLFAGDGFNQLCLASGGVPRDFLSLLAGLLNKVISNEITKIGKIEVTEMAISEINGKISSLKSDSSDETTKLESTLQYIKQEILNSKRSNVFLVCKDDIDSYTDEYDLLRQLMDLRLFEYQVSSVSSQLISFW